MAQVVFEDLEETGHTWMVFFSIHSAEWAAGSEGLRRGSAPHAQAPGFDAL